MHKTSYGTQPTMATDYIQSLVLCLPDLVNRIDDDEILEGRRKECAKVAAYRNGYWHHSLRMAPSPGSLEIFSSSRPVADRLWLSLEHFSRNDLFRGLDHAPGAWAVHLYSIHRVHTAFPRSHRVPASCCSNFADSALHLPIRGSNLLRAFGGAYARLVIFFDLILLC